MLAVALLLPFLVGVAICEDDQTMVTRRTFANWKALRGSVLNEPPLCQKAIDLGIVIDRRTVADWNDVKEFVKTLASQFYISDDMVHVGFTLFDDKAELRLKFNDLIGSSNNLEAIYKLIDTFGPGPSGEDKVIDEALQLDLTDLFIDYAGARGYDQVKSYVMYYIIVSFLHSLLVHGRRGAGAIDGRKAKFLKPGQKETPAQYVARKLESEADVKVLVVGIGIADPIELWEIAGGMEVPSKAAQNVFNAMKDIKYQANQV
ncbi:biological adhesion [Desmophyllum pertusum]|uniref:Biological adhesion n=1 Tax=Desmophyllum pertusum TaxID=174260 RepID=A0A9W9ZYC1_9CNID|nr:biological adhesion [Desmophyllum pertusum]